MTDTIIHCLVLLTMPLLLPGVIAKTKAVFAGRTGSPCFQYYYDFFKLLRKNSVFSETTTWVFKAGPVINLAATIIAAMLVPFGRHHSPVSFSGDIILFAYLWGLARFFTTIAALDTGSSFEGMGAAREVTFSCLAEPTLFFVMLTMSRLSDSLSLSEMLGFATPAIWFKAGSTMVLIVISLFIILLAENCRIPFDDPNTHLELTMIHEVMVLDHSGPDFGYIIYGAAMKLFIIGSIFMNIVMPVKTGNAYSDWGLFIIEMLFLAVVIGCVESMMARLRMIRIPQLLIAATILSAFSIMLILR
ncbi:respiratory chain complex I subunit 1 family protein [Desulforegula conservatrix]|uniref:respiratory chain complex I subunit 1 family protein n=1 Tax=Desulforegula conservatrix TaxID=153026 RepID=UPI0003FB8FEB|nr:NADH-quinone oxidoreductase subunit H [Desulforegula conservatrix]